MADAADAATRLNDSPSVQDPQMQAALEQRITHRWKCTVRVRPVPPKCSESMLHEVCPEMIACRIPWNTIKHRSKGVAFLEFSNEDAARRWEQAAGNITLGNRNLKADRRGISGEELDSNIAEHKMSIDDYNACRLVVTGIHWRCTKEQVGYSNTLSCMCTSVALSYIFRANDFLWYRN